MEKPIENYWTIRLGNLKEAMEKNNFEVFLAKDIDETKQIVLEKIIPSVGAKSISWGGSLTFTASNLYEALKNHFQKAG